MNLTAKLRSGITQALFCILLIFSVGTTKADSSRTVVFISDLHMGIGQDDNGKWYPTEDFRWPKALEGFLTYISDQGNDAVDLVVVGDFLELWQPPAHVECKGPNANYGCSVAEIQEIVRAVIAGHRDDIGALAKFAKKGENCIHVIPGNHDAALLIDDVWSPVAEALGADDACVKRADSGRWTSADGRIAAEHGHQIGWDPNRYSKWPEVTRTINGDIYLRKPWGEHFVQKIFNDTEADSPLIDNLSPNSAGAKYRMSDRGVAASAGDVARFLKFNLMETSLSQKISILGEKTDPEEPPEWDVKGARDLGWKLFAGALASDDVLANALGNSTASRDLKRALGELARDIDQFPNDEVLALCDQLAIRKGDAKCPTTVPSTLGYLVSKLASSRKRTVGPYVKRIWDENPKLRVFVYGHTHSFENEWTRKISSRVSVRVLNDGAFLRLIDDAKFRQVARSRNLSPGEALRVLQLDELPACYTYVRVTESATGGLNRVLQAWYMEEDSTGESIEVCDPRCADVGHGCD